MSDEFLFRRAAFSCFILLTAFAAYGLALDPSQPPATYLRKDFTVEDGLPDNVVNAIVQTRNGLLWVGTEAGLASFDGEHFTPIHFSGGVASERPVSTLAVTPDGGLWVGTDSGLVLIPSAALDHFAPALSRLYDVGPDLSNEITCLHVSRAGVLWVGTNQGLYRMDRDHFVPVIPHESISRIEEASDGNLLIITGHGFVEWDGTRVVRHPELAARLGVPADGIFHVYQDRNSNMWYCTAKGVARQSGSLMERITPYGGLRPWSAYRAYEDLQGNVWIDLKPGLFRVRGSALEPLAPHLPARAMYADRDGDLWVGSNGDGLVRFKDRTIRMYTTTEGLPIGTPMALLVTHSGRLWVGNNCGGLSWLDGERFKTYREKDGLSNSCVWALAEGSNHELWIGTWGGGLFRFRNGRFTQYSTPEGLPSVVVLSILAARDGSLWIATPDGLSHMQDGRFRNYTTADGLSSNHVNTVYQDRSGNIWAGTNKGLDRLAGARFAPVLATRDFLDVPYISLGEDSLGNLYALSGAKGITRVADNRSVSVVEGLNLLDMVESKRGDLWFSGAKGIFRIAAADLERAEQGREAPLNYASFGRADGMNSVECSVGEPDLALTPDGKLWVATVKGLAMLDLRRLPHSHLRPSIFVEEVTVGSKQELAARQLTLPPGRHHVELRFTAVDLASPEKIRLQYRLDGVDRNWLDADSTRTAIYTSIPVGAHASHIRATNDDGVWDRTGIVYNVTQLPYFYQTNWFRIAAAAALLLLLASAYRLRVRRICRQIEGRLEERLGERERIARELHDTLLQSVQGLILRFQAVAQRIPETEAPRQMMESALDRADQVLAEARDRVKGMRKPMDSILDLPEALTQAGEELAQGSGIKFTLVVEGSPIELHPVVRDEAYWIGREALANAFRHSQGRRIEIEIAYGRRELRLRFRDDGRGLDSHLLQTGRPGHWGMQGMRERAQKIGAHLKAWSRPGAGTEVELRVPASMAYHTGRGQLSWLGFLGRGVPTDGESKQSYKSPRRG
jgi:signal transduction histidine kinase